MRFSGVRFALILAAAALWTGLSFAGPRQMLAIVDATAGVKISGVAVHGESAVFAGDSIETPADTSAAVRFPGTRQVQVLPESMVRFEMTAEGRPAAQVTTGTILTTTAGQRAVTVATGKYRVQPRGERESVYFVAVLPDQSTVIGARGGSVAITEVRSGKTYVLAPGRYIAFSPGASGLPAQQQEQNEQAPGKPAGQGAPPAQPPAKSEQAPGKAAGPAAPPPPPPPPAHLAWHIGSLSHGASIAVVVAVAAGAAGGALAASAGKGGGSAASPNAP